MSKPIPNWTRNDIDHPKSEANELLAFHGFPYSFRHLQCSTMRAFACHGKIALNIGTETWGPSTHCFCHCFRRHELSCYQIYRDERQINGKNIQSHPTSSNIHLFGVPKDFKGLDISNCATWATTCVRKTPIFFSPLAVWFRALDATFSPLKNGKSFGKLYDLQHFYKKVE